MADINQVITLGIGTPAGIPEFLTFGLQINIPAPFIVSAIVAIRETASNALGIRATASGDTEIRSTSSGEVDL